MQLTAILRAGKIGTPVILRGIGFAKISPLEQRAFAKAIDEGIPNIIRRCRETAPFVLPPFLVSYLFYEFIEWLHVYINRKNPKDYENDE